MRAYTVHAPPAHVDDADAPEKFAFVKDGFSWPALFVPVLWILWHRLWLTLMGIIIWVLVVMWVDRLAGEMPATILAILGGILFAWEANNIRRWSLDRKGWRDVGGSFGDNLEEAEIRFFEKWGKADGIGWGDRRETIARAAYPAQRRGGAEDERIFGLFPEAER